MERDDSILLGHIYDTAMNIANRLKDVTRQEFDSNEDLRLSIAYKIQVIGEAASKISIPFRQAHSQMPWARIIGMRHRIVHDYMDINFNILWRTAKKDLLVLIEAIKPLVDE
mgnify:CR=1 FL=1